MAVGGTSALAVELVALAELCPHVEAIQGHAHAGLHQARRIQNDCLKNLAARGFAVREPEKRHGGILGLDRSHASKPDAGPLKTNEKAAISGGLVTA
jgi:hypothetical protein